MARYYNKTMLKKPRAEIEGKVETYEINQIPITTHNQTEKRATTLKMNSLNSKTVSELKNHPP